MIICTGSKNTSIVVIMDVLAFKQVSLVACRIQGVVCMCNQHFLLCSSADAEFMLLACSGITFLVFIGLWDLPSPPLFTSRFFHSFFHLLVDFPLLFSSFLSLPSPLGSAVTLG